ncbi:hypothetical protein PIROE2DRAFT_11353 [Piromyces sp. E2]|nr:hypothetical protein PIROE2DRAFT_11353 [Piromyces sp. E2]|eukprot:OUM62392.1 hypothetical protein PIROE2DRAFT_11353 [Piromyces sp. E2]
MSDQTWYGTDKKSTVLLFTYFVIAITVIDSILIILNGKKYFCAFELILLISLILLSEDIEYEDYDNIRIYKILYYLYIISNIYKLLYCIINGERNFEYFIPQKIIGFIGLFLKIYYYVLTVNYLERAQKKKQEEKNNRNLEENKN